MLTEILATPMDERRPNDLLPPRHVRADYPFLSESWLAQKRVTGGGIPFLKPSPKRVLYRRRSIEEFLNEREYLNTSQAAA